MFGKPSWFIMDRRWILAPVSWQGWVHLATWTVVGLAPTAYLGAVSRWPSALAWIVIAYAFYRLDAREIRRSEASESTVEDDDLFVIDENETESERFATRGYDMQIRA